MPPRFNLFAAAKARGKTIGEYIGHQDWTRWVQVHHELAFDRAEALLQEVSFGVSRKKAKQESERQE